MVCCSLVLQFTDIPSVGVRHEMGNDEKWDREGEIERLFDPDHITELLEYSPEEFIALIVIQIRQETDLISAWSKLLDENQQFRSQTFQVGDKEIAAPYFTETIMRAARITFRLLDTASAYREWRSTVGIRDIEFVALVSIFWFCL